MQLQEKLTSGKFAILAEMEPPKGTDTVAMIANAWAVKGKVDAFVIPEMSNAVMKMSSLGGALLLQSRGMETVLQVCCRDRNRLALQGDLLAAQALGVPNVMAVAGEEITHGDHHKARAVYDIDLPELLAAIQTQDANARMWQPVALNDVLRSAFQTAGRNLSKEEWEDYVGIDLGSYHQTCSEFPKGADVP